jgi:HPt (histidine-containing phosphotransfer) domain-containing protein
MLNLSLCLEKMNNDQALVNRLLDIIRTELPQQSKKIALSILDGDYDNISIIAHTIKGQLGYFGASSAVTLAASLEVAADNNLPIKELNSIYISLESELQKIQIELEAIKLQD